LAAAIEEVGELDRVMTLVNASIDARFVDQPVARVAAAGEQF
jgi:hypothetical protein